MLKENKISPSLINLIVHNEKQKQMYSEGIPREYYNKIIVTDRDKGIYGQMNWVFEHYPLGKHILKLDDDISSILKLKGDKLIKSYDLKNIIDKGFKLCEKNGLKLWGIYPTPNPYFMTSQKDYTLDLRFIVGALMGVINEKITINLAVKIKGDYDYAVKSYLNNGGIVRLNRTAFKYDIAKNEGVRISTMVSDAKILAKSYPNMISMNKRRNNEVNMGEILLKRNPIPNEN
tara:strand:+ start:6429 stop:7124 length:696 start_codon:yes stop_codon:yes gene_type:complete